MIAPDNYELLIGKINTFTRKYYFNNLLRGLIFLGAGLFSAFVIIVVSEYFGNFNTVFRTLLFYTFILLNLGLLGWLVIPSLLAWLKLGKTLTHNEAAAVIGKHFAGVNDKLLNTLQLKKQVDLDPRQRALIEASIDQKIELLKPVSFPSAVNIRENVKYIKYLVFPAAIICILAFAAPSIITESTRKLIRHNEYFAPVAPFSFIIENQSLAVLQGDDLKIGLKLKGNSLPSDVYIEVGGNTFKLDKENTSNFHYVFSNLQQNTGFKLVANGFQSKGYEITVNYRPALLHFDARLNYPGYLHKKNETIVNAGDLTIPAGTQVNWQLRTQYTSSVSFTMNNTVYQLLAAGPDLFDHSERVIKNSVYKISPLNKLINHADSVAYRINVISDEAPSISVTEKPDSVSLRSFYFTGRIQDDHGFSSLTFHYKITTAGNKSADQIFTLPVKVNLNQTQSDFFYFWDLKALHIKPGDQLAYYFEVADNDAVIGPKKVRSPERMLNVPDEKQLNEELNTGTQAIKEKMESAVTTAGQIEREAQKLNQQLLDKNTLSFDEKKQIEQLLEKKRELDAQIKDIQDDNKKNLYNRRENQQQNAELTEKQKQMEQLLNNVLDKKTQQMLKLLQQMMESEQKDAARDQLQKMQSDNKSLKKELDRMLELYKKLEFDQKLNQTVNQLNQLAEKQQKLAEQTPQPNTDRQALQQEQQKLKQDFDDVKKSLNELQKENDRAEEKNDYQNPQKEEQSIEQQMESSSQSLKKNDRKKSAQSQKDASKQMQQLAGKLKQSNEESEENEANADAKQLRELLKNLVNSSFDQEKVMQTLKGISSTDPNYITLSQKQKDIKDNLKTAEDSLYALSRRIPQIQSTVNTEIGAINDHIDKALENLGDRHTPEANRNQQFAMTSMNNLALMLSEALQHMQDAMKNAKGGKGKGKQKKMSMSQLSKQQQQLNQNMQQMRDQMQKQGGNQSESQHAAMSEQLARMAREQQAIRQQLDQINQEDNKDGKSGLGDLDKISKQMEQTERDLVNRRITDEALKRQQQIQSRMLEAEKAEQEREQDQKRESNAGKDLPPGYIKALQDYQQLKAKQTEQIRTVSPALNLYYKEKIKSYFEQLNVK